MSKYYPLQEIAHMEYWWEEIITIADLEAFAKKHGFSNDQVWLETRADYSSSIERHIYGKRPATEKEKKTHYKQWEDHEAAVKKERNKKAYAQKKAMEEYEQKEWERLNKKFGKNASANK